MNLLFLIWVVSLALAGSALAIMSALIVIRGVRAIRDQSRQRLRQRLLPLLLAASEDSLEPGGEAELRRHPAMTTELAAELFELVRGGALERLATNLRAFGFVEVLIKRSGRGNENDRMRAAESLGYFPGLDTEIALKRALADRSEKVRLAASLSLAQLGAAPPVRSLLDSLSSTGAQSGRLVEVLENLPSDRSSELIEVAFDNAVPVWIRAAAVNALGGTGQYSLVSQLGALARDSDAPELIAECVRAIGMLAHPTGADVVRWALLHPDWQVRAEGCEAASRIGLTDMSSRLGDLLDDDVWLVRFHAGHALAALGEIGQAELMRLAKSGPGQPQQTAALILAERGLAS